MQLFIKLVYTRIGRPVTCDLV